MPILPKHPLPSLSCGAAPAVLARFATHGSTRPSRRRPART
jgi:hypothetical protein